MLKMLSNKDSFFRQLLLILAGSLQTIVLATIVSNFGWTHELTLITSTISVLIYFIIYSVWKN
jgi:hypothetical protein